MGFEPITLRLEVLRAIQLRQQGTQQNIPIDILYILYKYYIF